MEWWFLLIILLGWGSGLFELQDKAILGIAAIILLGWLFEKY